MLASVFIRPQYSLAAARTAATLLDVIVQRIDSVARCEAVLLWHKYGQEANWGVALTPGPSPNQGEGESGCTPC